MTALWESGEEKCIFCLLLLFAVVTVLSTGASSCLMAAGTLFLLVKRLKDGTPLIESSELKRILLIYFALELLVAFNSFAVRESLKFVFSTAYRFVPLLLVTGYVRRRSQLRLLLLAFAVAVLVDDIYALWQFARNPVVMLASRPAGFNNHPNFLADFMLCGMTVCFFSLQRQYFSYRERLFFGLTGCLSFAVLLLTQTRGAWLAFFGILLLLGLAVRQYRRQFVAAVAGLLLLFGGLAMLSPGFNARIIGHTDPGFHSNAERRLMWASAVEMFRDYPLLGVGQEQFALFYNTKYISPAAKERGNPGDPLSGHGHPHNNFLYYLAEGGLAGAGAFVFLYGSLFLYLWRLYVKEQDSRVLPFALMGIVLLAALQLAGITNTNANQVPIMRTIWFLLGLSLVGDRIEREQSEKEI